MMNQQVQVRKNDLSQAEVVEVRMGELAPGAIRLDVESFAVTSNNVTYAVMGDSFGYWNFFLPMGADTDGRGIVPMWGHARVAQSNIPEIEVGERVYGYLPMADALDVTPGKVTPTGFVDLVEHRQPMSPVYNQYSRLAADPEHDPDHEAERMIFGPLFRTGFLIEYFMRQENWFGAGEAILTSASSKTAMGLADVSRRNSPDVKLIGLTSDENVEFVESTRLYDKVHTYTEIGNLPLHDCVTIDFAGNAEVLRTLHEHFTDMLKYSCLVGATHIEARSSFAEETKLPGPKPTLFFAPDHAVAFFKEHGVQKGSEIIAKEWRGFLKDVEGNVNIDRRQGLEAAREVFLAMTSGAVDPAKGIVIEP